MNEHNQEIEKRLEGLGNALRSTPSVVTNEMRRIEQMGRVGPLRSNSFTSTLFKSGLGIAACLLD